VLKSAALSNRSLSHAPHAALSKRLETVLALLEPCELLADVGTDHALLPIHAVRRGLSRHALAIDLREEPLQGARLNLVRARETARVTPLRADGFSGLAGRAVDAAVLAGLSGRTIEKLCREALRTLPKLRQLVVQPNQGADTLRAWAHAAGLHLRDEAMIEEHGRAFVVCAFVPGTGQDPAYEMTTAPLAVAFKVGPRLLARKDPVARGYCEAQRKRLAALVSAGSIALRSELAQFTTACQLLG
jgi:tRNA (adenine22-N1)-methyltransferase